MSNADEPDWGEARARIIGLGETSARKTYYAELQKKLEELKDSEAALRTVFNSTHDAIFIHDFDGNVEDVNEPMLALFRVTREEALRFHVTDYSVAPDGAKRLKAIYDELLVNSLDTVFEWRARRPVEGSELDVEVALRRAKWKNRDVIVAVVRDITERKMAEQEKRRLEEQLAQSRKMESVGQLAGGIAHDFNNMLMPILSFAMMLRDDMPKDDPRWGDLDEIVRSAERARGLTRQLLAFARRQRLELVPLQLDTVVTDLARMLERTLRENINLRLNLTPELGSIDGDVGQLEQVILNLAINAQDAMPDGGTLTLTTSMRYCNPGGHEQAPADYVVLSVSDTGTGMDEVTRSKVFEPFFTTKELGRGTGLGLSTVYGIVRQHGGFIELTSEVGRGTTFTLYFRSKSAVRTERGIEPSDSPRSATGECILLVEDQPEVCHATQRILERLGYQVLTASDGREALEKAQANKTALSLLISDIIMKEMNGREVFEKMRHIVPDLRVIYISGYPYEALQKKGDLDEGAYFLSKPFSINELAAKIRQALVP